jgi:ACT domain-containing protein
MTNFLFATGVRQRSLMHIQIKNLDFDSLEDSEVIKLCGCSRNSYYKYKKEIKAGEDVL